MNKDRKFFGFGRNVFVAGLVSFFMDVSSEMIYPLVPLFLANVLGVNKSLIGLIEGIAESTAKLGYSGDTLLNSEAVFKFWGVIFSFMSKRRRK